MNRSKIDFLYQNFRNYVCNPRFLVIHFGDFYIPPGALWRLADYCQHRVVKNLLAQFGVTSIPDEPGGIKQNAAVYLIDR